MKIILLFLTCANEKEADAIVELLLKKHLIACAKRLPIASAFRWKGKIETDNEILILMETVEEKLAAIEREVGRLHSYETPVLLAVPVNRASKGVEKWMRESLK